MIDEIVDRYMIAVHDNVDQFQNLKVCIYNVVPPVKYSDARNNPNLPFIGTDDERKEYVLYFNQKLKEACAKNGFLFFDIYDKYTDAEGFLDPDLADASVHIKDKKHIEDFIKANLL